MNKRRFHFPTGTESVYPFKVWSNANHTLMENWMNDNIMGDCERRYAENSEKDLMTQMFGSYRIGCPLLYSFELEIDAVLFSFMCQNKEFANHALRD